MTQPINERTPDMALRLECVRLARDSAVHEAEAIYRFVTGADDASPRERILQAMEDAGVT